MRVLYLFILLLFSNILVCAQSTQVAKKNGFDSVVNVLKVKRKITDEYLNKNGKSLMLYSKIPDREMPIRVLNEKWPDDGGISYNILTDTKGKIIMIAEIPFSESGDWYIAYTHYFDSEGNTYAFRREANIFDKSVKGGVIYEISLRYYDKSFKLLSQGRTLKDGKGKSIKNDGHIDAYNYKYNIYRNITDCLKAYNIKL